MTRPDYIVRQDRLRETAEFVERQNITADDLFEALASSRRRFLIDQIGSIELDEHLTINDLAIGLAFLEDDDVDSLDRIPTTARKRFYISIYQTHLPNLDEAGIVDYDDRAKTVRPTELTRVVRGLMLNVRRGLGDVGVEI